MDVEAATDEITDLIASIEMHRQEIERETGLAASCSYALGKLQEVLQREQEALRAQGAGDAQGANVRAVTRALDKVRSLAANGGRRRAPGMARGPQGPRHHAPPRRGIGDGRRPAGRRSGR